MINLVVDLFTVVVGLCVVCVCLGDCVLGLLWLVVGFLGGLRGVWLGLVLNCDLCWFGIAFTVD